MATTVGQIGLNMVLNSSQFRQQINGIKGQAETASTKISSSFKKIGAAIAATFSVAMIKKFAKDCTSAAAVQTEAETKLTTVMQQRMKATTSSIQKIKEYASAQQDLGVVGDEIQLSGAQQLSTFLKTDSALKTLIPAMNNLAVQQNGVSVGASEMVNIGNLMGKAMHGQTSALTRVGITFDEAEEKVMKYGNEQERAAMLAQIITNNVGQMNEAIAKTPAGRIQQLKNSFGDMQETIGRALNNVFMPLLKYINAAVQRLSALSSKFEEFTAKIFGNSNNSVTSFSGASESVENLTDEAENSSAAIDGVADSAEKAKRSIAGFDKLNILSKENKTESDSSTSAVHNSTGNNNLTSAMSKSIDKFTSTWNTKGQRVINSIKKSFNSIKGAAQAIGESWSNVWNNGSGKKLLNNIKSLLSNIFDIIGNIAESFKKAWNKADLGNKVVQSVIDRINSLIEIVNTIAKDFKEVWNSGVGERIWSNILEIIKNCNKYTTTLRNKIKEAWDKNETGKRIWKTILGIVEDITGFLKEMSEIRLKWLESLDLSPIVEAVADLGEAFRELLKACGDKLKNAYQNILLPLAKWTIEKAVPKLIEALAGAFELLGKFIKKIPVSLLTGIAAAIGTVVAAFKAFKIAQEVKKHFDKIKKAFLDFKGEIIKHPYAAIITAIATAVIALISAMKTYSNEQWSNSSLKKEIDKTAELADKLSTLADEMSTEIEEINDTELTMKVDFENIDKMKERLKEIIEDGTIDESEEGEYKTIIDLLGKKVDGFETNWNNLTLEEVDGKIVIKDNIDEVNKKLDDLVTNWEITQAKLTFSDIYSNLQTDVAKQKIQIETEDKNNNIDEAKKDLIDYIYEKSSLSKKEAELLTNELIKQKGDFEKTNKSLKAQLSDSISISKFKNLHFALNQEGNHGLESVFGWNNITGDASSHIKEAVDTISDLNKNQSKAKDTYDGLVDTMDKYKSALSTINGGSKNYNDYIKLSTEYGMSHDAVLSLLKDDGITTWEELESAAKKSSNETNNALDKTDGKWHESSKKQKALAHNTADTVEECTVKAKSSVKSNLEEEVPKSISSMWQKIKGVFTSGDGFVKIKDAIWGVFKDAINKLISGINSLIRKPFDLLNDAFDNVRNFEFFGKKVFDWLPKIEAPQIPKLAKGAIVKAPTLAVVGDNAGANSGNPEVISPLNKLQSMINTSSGQDVVVLGQILDYLKRIYEMFIVFRNNGGNTYEFVANLNGSQLFNEVVRQNELSKKRHNGKSVLS